MEVENEENFDELQENQNVVKIDPELEENVSDQPVEEDEEREKVLKRISFPIKNGKATEVKQVSRAHHYPMIEEYDFRNDFRNRTIRIRLAPSTHIRPYQERCLNKMFGNGRARSGLIVLPCGAGKTIVGITAAVTIKKSCIVVCNSTLSALQWRDSFLSFCDVKGDCIRILVKDKRDPLPNPCILLTTYYQLIKRRKINKEREAILNEIASREWGLLVLDEVHVCPADSFQEVVSTVKAHCKLGLTATLVREDGKIKDLDFLIGPKLYEANWMDLTNKGYLSPVRCLEVWCDMNPLFYNEFLRRSKEYNKQKLLAVVNPEKLKALAYLLYIHVQRGDKILVFCDSIFPLHKFGELFGYRYLDGSCGEPYRKRVLNDFRNSSAGSVVFLSKIGDTSIDLPEATVLIQVEGQEGSRRQEAQRLGRILRPKMGLSMGNQAFFYTLVSRDTKEVGNALNRQRYLMAQGYTYKVLVNITKGLTREMIQRIPKMQQICSGDFAKNLLQESLEAKAEEMQRHERSKMLEEVNSKVQRRRGMTKIGRKIKGAATYSGNMLSMYSEKRHR